MTGPGSAPGDPVPLWLLDVDGVINAVGVVPDSDTWPRWQRGVARTDNGSRTWGITWAPDAIAQLKEWHARGVVEIAWLTTWGYDANVELAALLGMPRLPVAGTPPSRVVPSTGGGVAGGGASTHARVAGADAADPFTGRWWKFDVVRRLVAADPRRRLVWTDDDLAVEPEVVAWMRAHTTSLLVAPDPRHGLTPAHLQAIDRYLQVLPAAGY